MAATFALSVRGQRALVTNLFAADRQISEAVRLVTLQTAVRVHAAAYQMAPVDEGFMRDQLRIEMSPGGLAFEVGYRDEDFEAAGKEPYYFFQELGFHHYATGEYIRNAHVEPAFHAEERGYRDGIRSAVLSAIARLPRAA